MKTQNLTSIGKACGLLQVMPDQISKAAAAIGIEPRLVADGVRYFDHGDIGKIAAHLRQQVAASNPLAARAANLH